MELIDSQTKTRECALKCSDRKKKEKKEVL